MTKLKQKVTVISLLVLAFFGLSAQWTPLPPPEHPSNPQMETFDWINENIIQPKCASCHFHEENLGSLEAILHYAVKPGKPDTSGLYSMVAASAQTGGERPPMPQDGDPLSDDETRAIYWWIHDYHQ